MPIESFVNRVRQGPVFRSFFHFTDAKNIASISANGLLSMSELRKRGIPVTTGGNQWSLDADIGCGMDAYVHLCFRDNQPMAYAATQDGRIESLKWLKIDPAVASEPGVLVSDDVANQRDITPLPIAQMLDSLDLDVIYNRHEWKDPAIQARFRIVERYEILVPISIARDYIIA